MLMDVEAIYKFALGKKSVSVISSVSGCMTNNNKCQHVAQEIGYGVNSPTQTGLCGREKEIMSRHPH